MTGNEVVGIVIILITMALVGIMLHILGSIATMEHTKIQEEAKKQNWKPYNPKNSQNIYGNDNAHPQLAPKEMIGERLVGSQGLVNVVERRYEDSSLIMYYVEKNKIALFSSPKYEVAEAYAEGYRAGRLGSGISEFLPKQP